MNKPIALVHAGTDSPAARAAGLLAQARHEAGVHVALVLTQMGDIARMADDVAAGGDIYPPGVRDQMSRLADNLQRSAANMAMLMERVR